MHKSLFVMSLALAGLSMSVAAPSGLEAQRNRNQNLKKLLVVTPLPDAPEDSAYAVAFAEQLRDRATGKLRNRMRVFDTEDYCEALGSSGFPCGTLLDNNSADQLANFMGADAYIIGVVANAGTSPSFTMRMVDARRSGLSGVQSFRGEAGVDVRSFADIVADTVRNQYRAAQDVQACSDRRDRGDLRGARARAEDAFERYPNHPAAALCVSYLFEASQQPVDSLIWIFGKVVAGDPASSRGWERLGRLYFQQGDTVSAIEAFGGQLAAEPRNHTLRIQNSQMWAEIDSLDKALEILEAGVEYDADRFIQLQVATCVDADAWGCVLELSDRRLARDEDLGSDLEFLQSVIGAATLAADTAASVRWTGAAVRAFPDDNRILQNHAAWLKEAGKIDSALTIFTLIAQRDSANTTALLAIVSIMLDRYVVDSVTPVDSLSLNTMDSLLTVATERAAGDDSTLGTIGSLYLSPGIRYAQLRIHQRLAAELLARSLEYPLAASVVGQANFFLGYMTTFYLGDIFAEVRATESCDAVDSYEQQVMRGKNSLIKGRDIAPDFADRILEGQYIRYEAVIPQFREMLECAVPSSNR